MATEDVKGLNLLLRRHFLTQPYRSLSNYVYSNIYRSTALFANYANHWSISNFKHHSDIV